MNFARKSVCCLLFVLGVFWTSHAAAIGSIRVVALSNDPAPGGVGRFGSFETPIISKAGQVAFEATFVDASGNIGNGIYFGTARNNLQEIARSGGTLSINSPWALNSAGQVAFRGSLVKSESILIGDGSSLSEIAAAKKTTPDGDSTYEELGRISLNETGEVAFSAWLLNGSVYKTGIFRGSSAGAVVPIMRDGDLLPDGSAQVIHLTTDLPETTPIDSSGRVAFSARMRDLSTSADPYAALYLSDGIVTTQIVRGGQTTPDGDRTINGVDQPTLNESGQLAFPATLVPVATGGPFGWGLYRSDGTTLIEMARTGQNAPDNNGVFDEYELRLNTPTMNDKGQVAFVANLKETNRGTIDDVGLFLFDDATGLRQIARGGDASLDGNGFFADFSLLPGLNESGQIAFHATLSNTHQGLLDRNGIFFYDDAVGVTAVARRGDPLLDSTILDFTITGSSAVGLATASNISNLGEVAFSFRLANGQRGIAIWSIPEPSAAALTSVGLIFVFFGVREHTKFGATV